MSKKTRWRLDVGLKAKVALEVIRDETTIAELAAKYHPNLIYACKKQLLESSAAVFSSGAGPPRQPQAGATGEAADGARGVGAKATRKEERPSPYKRTALVPSLGSTALPPAHQTGGLPQ